MKPAPFDLHRPRSLEESVSLLVEHGEDAKLLAGGQSLLPLMAMRLATPEQVVDLTLVDELTSIEPTADGGIRVGAMATHRSVGADPLVASGAPLLSRAVPLVGHAAIRNRGTFGGSVAHADPASEHPAVCIALGASMEITGPRGVRTVPAAEFFETIFTTVLQPDEVLSAVVFPKAGLRRGQAIEEVVRRNGDFALAGAACTIELDSSERISAATVVLFGVADRPWPAQGAAAALVGQPAEIDLGPIGELAVVDLDPADSVHAPGWYRREVAAVMVVRALRRAIAEASGGPR